MIEEEKVLVLSQLVISLKEAVLEMENAINEKNESKFLVVKNSLNKLNKEIKENLI